MQKPSFMNMLSIMRVLTVDFLSFQRNTNNTPSLFPCQFSIPLANYCDDIFAAELDRKVNEQCTKELCPQLNDNIESLFDQLVPQIKSHVAVALRASLDKEYGEPL